MKPALVSAEQLATRMSEDADLVVVDASAVMPSPRFDGDHSVGSGRDDWLAARIPLSIHLDLAEELADLDGPFHFVPPHPQELADRLAARGIGQGTHVVAYDKGDMLWAARLWWVLRWIGVQVSVLDGGLPAWSQHHLVDLDGDPPPLSPVERWTVGETLDAWATPDEVAALSRGDALGALVCGLGPDVFAGTVATRYARRGHIPGSVNVPARSHVGADGLLRSLPELRRAWAAVPRGPIVVYCGGGVSASLSALALHEIGITDVRIYDGSLEEWARDTSRPLNVVPSASRASLTA